jgi:polysaccharide pyruvyl transferase CsaB
MAEKILLVGNYGAQNFGDDLLLIASKIGIKKFFPESEIIVMSPDPHADSPLPAAGFRSWLKMSTFKAKRALKKCDFVVFGGGGLFNTDEPYSLFIWGRVIRYAYKYHKRVYLLGQSISEKNPESLSKLFSKINLITVRDKCSEKILKRLNLKAPVRLTADLGFILDSSRIPSVESKFDDDFVIVNLRKTSNVDITTTHLALDIIINYFTKNTPYSIYLLPFGKEDHLFLNELAASYKENGKVFVLPADRDSCFSALSSAKAVISERLHPSIVAMLLGKPFLGLSYSSKISGLYSDLDLDEWCMDLRSFDHLAQSKLRSTLPLLQDLIENSQAQISSSIINEVREKAFQNFELLKVMVEDD